jgi:hypothetical protein
MAHSKGHFGWSQTPEAKEFRAVAGSANCLFFSTERFAKNFISGLKMVKNFGKEEKVSKNPFQWFF